MLVLLAALVCWSHLQVSLGGLLAGLLPALCPVPLQLRKPNRSQRQVTVAVKNGEAPKVRQIHP